MKIRLTWAFLLVVLIAGLVSAQDRGIQILSHKEEVFLNKDCKTTETCNLKKVEYFTEDYKVTMDDGYNYGTRFFARYETKSSKNLEEYVFVQFIKGYVFYSKLSDENVVISYNFVYPRDDGPIVFKFTDWVIDSYDLDPVYATIPGETRLYGYRWNTIKNSFSTKTEKIYGQTKPKTPRLYIVDHPGTVFYVNGSAKNISLEFRTCIYKAKDVPDNITHDNIYFAKPINCYEWKSLFVYNHLSGMFENKLHIVETDQQ